MDFDDLILDHKQSEGFQNFQHHGKLQTCLLRKVKVTGFEVTASCFVVNT